MNFDEIMGPGELVRVKEWVLKVLKVAVKLEERKKWLLEGCFVGCVEWKGTRGHQGGGGGGCTGCWS